MFLVAFELRDLVEGARHRRKGSQIEQAATQGQNEDEEHPRCLDGSFEVVVMHDVVKDAKDVKDQADPRDETGEILSRDEGVEQGVVY